MAALVANQSSAFCPAAMMAFFCLSLSLANDALDIRIGSYMNHSAWQTEVVTYQ